MANIIGLVGLIGSGKGTVGDMLVSRGYVNESFAASLKDATASIFNWDRALLEGDTQASRAWREQTDSWWSERLGIPDATPRLILQLMGTEVMRNHFHQDIWILSMEARLRDASHDIVVTDARFPNEIAMIRRLGGTVVRVMRGADPEWFSLAVSDPDSMPHVYPHVHASEYSWARCVPDYLITNDGTLEDLEQTVRDLLADLPDASQ